MIKSLTRLVGPGALALAIAAGSVVPAFAQNGQPNNQGYIVTITQVDTSQFPRISVWVSVTDAQGNPVSNVSDTAFSLIENGQPVQIKEVHQAGEQTGQQGTVTAVLTIDRSGSMNTSGKIDAAKAAANAFVDLMRSQDKTGVVVFNTQVDVIQPITSDKDSLHKAINGIKALNDTAMYDALQTSVGLLNGVQGRKVIILLSDGLDNRSKQSVATVVGGLEPAETSVYTIGLGDPAKGTSSMAGIDEGALKDIAAKSRGAYSYAPDPSGLQKLYQQISTRVQNEYRLTYISPSTLRDGVRRGLEVQVAQASAVKGSYNPGGVIPETAQALGWPVFGGLLLGLVALLALPDILRGVGGAAGGKRLFKKKSRVKLTGGDAAQPAAPKPKPAASRVRLHGKGN